MNLKEKFIISEDERYIVIDRKLLRELPLIISAPFTEALGRFQDGLNLVGHSSPKYKVSIVPKKEG